MYSNQNNKEFMHIIGYILVAAVVVIGAIHIFNVIRDDRHSGEV
jgi:hypothetical protein